MLKIKRGIFVVIFVMVSFIVCMAHADKFKEPSSAKQIRQKAPRINKGFYYTRTNMWFERPSNFLSVNFHRGKIIPAGTKVEVLKRGRSVIVFCNQDSGREYSYIHSTKHSRIKLRELFYRYFSKESVMAEEGAFSECTKGEQENIKQGTIDVGMSKDAVLMAYGYPPTHMTRELTSNSWTYWESRAGRIVVYFNNGVVSEIEGRE